MRELLLAIQVVGPLVPLLQTVLWVVFIVGVLATFWTQVNRLVDALVSRVQSGNQLKVGPLELGADLKKLEPIAPGQDEAESLATPKSEWSEERTRIYREQRGVFLTHILFPSKRFGQRYDIFVYLIRHKTTDLSDVDRAEFYLGHMWGDKVFRETPSDGMIGFTTSAYSPFLCTCRVHFKDKTSISLSRYVDFEMEKLFHETEASKS